MRLHLRKWLGVARGWRGQLAAGSTEMFLLSACCLLLLSYTPLPAACCCCPTPHWGYLMQHLHHAGQHSHPGWCMAVGRSGRCRGRNHDADVELHSYILSDACSAAAVCLLRDPSTPTVLWPSVSSVHAAAAYNSHAPQPASATVRHCFPNWPVCQRPSGSSTVLQVGSATCIWNSHLDLPAPCGSANQT